MKKITNFEIIPGKGFGNLFFGMNYEEVINMLGKPDEVIDSEEDDLDEVYADSLTVFYDELGVAMFFEKIEENGPMTLQSLDIEITESTIFGKKLFEMPKNELIEFIEQQTKEKPEIEHDEDFADFDIADFDNNGISLQFDKNELATITLYNIV